ncbi:PspC domain-containing protein [Streptococcus pacificus]|nr:PspC domain-containing protein [Streptococcus pacificus]
MMTKWYKKRENSWLAGVLSGISDKFSIDLGFLRFLFLIIFLYARGALLVYFILALVLPYKEDETHKAYHKGPRKRKDAEPLDEKEDWFW